MKRLKVGIIGLGEVAQIIHLPILEALHEKFEIVAICDISNQLLNAMGEKYKVDRRFTDPKELNAQKDLDAVFILTSNEYHADYAIDALKNKKYVFLEKPMCFSLADADAIIKARDVSGVQVMIGYMRRFAPAFTRAVAEVKNLKNINYVRIRDIIGQNRFFTEKTSNVIRPADIPEEAVKDRAERAKRMMREALGEVPQELINTYRLLNGLSSHDVSAMREMIGMPKRVIAAREWKNGNFINAIFEYDGFCVMFETGVDNQRRFDAHIEVYGDEKAIKVQYDTPYIRHLPIMMQISETIGESYSESEIRPTFLDPYTVEIEYFHDVATQGIIPKTTPEDAKEDLEIFQLIMEQLKKN